VLIQRERKFARNVGRVLGDEVAERALDRLRRPDDLQASELLAELGAPVGGRA